jgi:transmembrane sensor
VATHTVSDEVREQAAGWHDRVSRNGASEELRRELQSWLAKSPAHRLAYEEVAQTWARLQSIASDPQILELRHEAALRLTRDASARYRPWKLAAAAAVLLCLALTLMSILPQSGGRSVSAALLAAFQGHKTTDYATATGERLTVNLEDGSQITLDTQSTLAVEYTSTERRVRLTRGQALFEVAKDRMRPFVVDAHHRRLVALGTAFDVRLEGAQVKVTMVEGTVRVERAPAPMAATTSDPSERGNQSVGQLSASGSSAIATITAGEQLIAVEGHQDSVRPADAERTTSWRHGQIIFDDSRLADAIAELNRYSLTQLELADPALADLRLSGAFAIGRPQLFLEALTSYFPIEAVQSDERRVLLKARP